MPGRDRYKPRVYPLAFAGRACAKTGLTNDDTFGGAAVAGHRRDVATDQGIVLAERHGTDLGIVDRNTELGVARRTNHRYNVATGIEFDERLLLPVQITDGARKSFMRAQLVPSINKAVYVGSRCTDRLKTV